MSFYLHDTVHEKSTWQQKNSQHSNYNEEKDHGEGQPFLGYKGITQKENRDARARQSFFQSPSNCWEGAVKTPVQY